jgi:predicted ATPase
MINPNADRDFIETADLSHTKVFPKFLRQITFSPFRHIPDLVIDFISPVSVITGTNRSGKSTILMAIACSHFDFQKRNSTNGKLERKTWSSLMKFTAEDNQGQDWNYSLLYKTGAKEEIKFGQRKFETKKWSGVGKKEGQIVDRQVIFIDLDRILPPRNFSERIFRIAKSKSSGSFLKEVQSHLSYVLEEEFTLSKVAEYLDKEIFTYRNAYRYSSYNAASGEEVLVRIIADSLSAKQNSLILIDEIELGLHPKVQRRLMDVIYSIARTNSKQFIVTTHSSTILSSVTNSSRIFIERNIDNTYKVITKISVNAALSKMDSAVYPLVDLYCEDDETKWMIMMAVDELNKDRNLNNFQRLINVIVSGSAENTYQNYKSHERTYNLKKIRSGYACILDGDMRTSNRYPPENKLHFMFSNECPERFLIRAYLTTNPHSSLSYHVQNSDPHCLFAKMVEFGLCVDKNGAFKACFHSFRNTTEGERYFSELKNFLFETALAFSPDL